MKTTLAFFRVVIACAGLFVAAALLAADGFYTTPRASVLISGGAMMNGEHFADRMLPVMRARSYSGAEDRRNPPWAAS